MLTPEQRDAIDRVSQRGDGLGFIAVSALLADRAETAQELEEICPAHDWVSGPVVEMEGGGHTTTVVCTTGCVACALTALIERIK